MITTDLASAQILFLLVTDDNRQIASLTADLQRSRYRYGLATCAGPATMTHWLEQQIESNDGRLPIILLIDDRFARSNSRSLLQLAKDAGKRTAIQSIVTHPPTATGKRQELLALGARLFDSEETGELIVH